MNRFELVDIKKLPKGKPLERPLHPKKRRVWNPPPETDVTQPAPSSSTDLLPSYQHAGVEVFEENTVEEVEVEYILEEEDEEPTMPSSPVTPPSSALAENGGKGNSSAMNTPTGSRSRRALGGSNKVEYNYGSELDSDDSGDEDLLAPMIVSRTIREAVDTPDDDFGDDDDDDDDDNDGEELEPSQLMKMIMMMKSQSQSAVSSGDPSAVTTLFDRNIDSTPIPNQSETLLPHDLFDFQWMPFPYPPIPTNKRRESFTQDKVGPTAPSENAYDIFTSIWDKQIMEHIVNETNRYAQEVAAQKIARNTLGPRSRINFWKDTTTDELYVFFAITLAMGVVVKSSLIEYWGADGEIFSTPGFSAHMSVKRYQLLSSCMHFNNNGHMRVKKLSRSKAKLFKIDPIIVHLNDKFQSLYTLNQNVALDESLLQWKGRLSINQFIPNKKAKVGIKSYEICESQTGYLWRFEVHASKTLTVEQEPQTVLDAATPAIVLRLMKGLEYKGYTLWMDNFYNSPALARRLKSLGIDVVGTLRTNRQYVPDELRHLTKANMRPGQIIGCTSGDVDLIVWRDLNKVATISTYHGNETATYNGKTKPILIYDYNIMMGGVDKKDQMLAMYPVERKRTIVWYKKLFYRLLNVSVLNSYLIYKKSTKSTSHRSFRRDLISSLLKRHSSDVIISRSPVKTAFSAFFANTHYLAQRPIGQNKSRLRRKCCVCKNLTQYYCAGCNDKSVCIETCFVSLHSS